MYEPLLLNSEEAPVQIFSSMSLTETSINCPESVVCYVKGTNNEKKNCMFNKSNN